MVVASVAPNTADSAGGLGRFTNTLDMARGKRGPVSRRPRAHDDQSDFLQGVRDYGTDRRSWHSNATGLHCRAVFELSLKVPHLRQGAEIAEVVDNPSIWGLCSALWEQREFLWLNF